MKVDVDIFRKLGDKLKKLVDKLEKLLDKSIKLVDKSIILVNKQSKVLDKSQNCFDKPSSPEKHTYVAEKCPPILGSSLKDFLSLSLRSAALSRQRTYDCRSAMLHIRPRKMSSD